MGYEKYGVHDKWRDAFSALMSYITHSTKQPTSNSFSEYENLLLLLYFSRYNDWKLHEIGSYRNSLDET